MASHEPDPRILTIAGVPQPVPPTEAERVQGRFDDKANDKKVYAVAKQMHEEGYSMAELNKIIAAKTEGRYPGYVTMMQDLDPDPSAFEAFARNAEQQFMFGALSRVPQLATAGVQQVIPGGENFRQSYPRQREEWVEARDRATEAHPYAALAGDVAGTGADLVLGAKGLGAAKKVATSGRRAAIAAQEIGERAGGQAGLQVVEKVGDDGARVAFDILKETFPEKRGMEIGREIFRKGTKDAVDVAELVMRTGDDLTIRAAREGFGRTAEEAISKGGAKAARDILRRSDVIRSLYPEAGEEIIKFLTKYRGGEITAEVAIAGLKKLGFIIGVGGGGVGILSLID